MQPHMALSPDGVVDPVYVRQAVDHILKTCLPPEDYEPETERYIVREIILKVLVGSVLPRITQPWFIHKVILDQLGPENAAGKVPEVSALPGSCPGVGSDWDVGWGTRAHLYIMPCTFCPLPSEHRVSMLRHNRAINIYCCIQADPGSDPQPTLLCWLLY